MPEQELVSIIAVTSLLISFICLSSIAGIIYRVYKKIRSRDGELEKLHRDFSVICATATRASSRTVHLEKQLRKMLARQEQIELRDPMNHSYGQAISMAKKGMGVDELVNILGLPRGEAELIALMHNIKKAS